MGAKSEKRFLVYITVVMLAFLFIINFFVPITYAVNDDTTMKAIASGIMTGEPDGHLIFIKYSLGVVIAFFYRLFGGIDWYGCLMLGIILVCTMLLIFRAKRFFKNHVVYGAISVLAIFIITFFENYVNFQFTVVSAIAAATAIFYYNTIDITKNHYQREYLVVILLAWISYCVRSETFIMALPFAGLSFLFKDDKWKEKIIVGLVLLVGLVAITFIEKSAYADEAWQFYEQYNVDRSGIYDYYGVPKYEDNKEFYSSINIKAHDVQNLEEYNLYMIDGIEDGKIQKIVEYAQEQQSQEEWSVRIQECIRLVIKGCLKNRSILLNMLAKLVIFANLWYEIKHRKKTALLNLLFVCVEIMLVLYLGFDGRILTRVMTSLYLIEFYSVISIWCKEHQESVDQLLSSLISKCALIGMIALSVFMIFDVYENQKVQYEDNLEWEDLQKFYQENSENIYFINTYEIWQYTDNFNVFEECQMKNYSKLGEWSTFSPAEYSEMKRYGITDVDDALIENDNVYLIYREPFDAITQHYMENYKDVEWIKVDEAPVAGEMVPVYKLQGEKND